ncbi:MAG: hypothetical protein JO078_05685 [Candidatus Eremiobacteraeota bacterium]|nr:hypothetical protein [Candidatus Eremiobacteraeota bacterium]MBV9056314.1 hypothetical protein [Candidatus Eremiobacteraeota bacterium]MBV9699600.1 hypothetical protein [Candidatus Eremiobacteraeota bacterium]
MSFTSNIQITKNDPAVLYDATETSGVWHEDHEINGVRYHAANAKFDDKINFTWSLANASQPAYARTQNTDGSTSYLYMPANSGPWATSAWRGTGQPLIYHAVNYGMSPSASAADNTTALTNAITAAFSTGGIVLIPAGLYQINGTIIFNYAGTPGDDQGIIITGAGGTAELRQNAYQDMFQFTSLTSGRGVRFRDLRISYVVPLNPPPPQPYAIRTTDCINITCERVYFSACPAFINDNRSNECGLFDCTIDYGAGVPGLTLVYLTGSQDFVDHCRFSQTSVAKGGPTGVVGIVIQTASVPYVSNTHFDDLDTAIWIQGGSNSLLRATLSNVSCECFTYGLRIQPLSNSVDIFQVFVNDCDFARAPDSTAVSPGILVDTNGGPAANVSDIFFSNCMSHDWAAAGMEIRGGQDIEVIGGRFGSNASDPSMLLSGGIAITGPAQNVTIVGADCTGSIPPYSSEPTRGTQPHGISVTGAVVAMQVRGCNLNGNGQNNNQPLYVGTAGKDLRVTDCPGYNDQPASARTLLSGTPPSGAFSNTMAWTGAPQGWYGPIAFYVWGSGVSNIVIDGVTTMLTSGAFELGQGDSASVGFSGNPHFLALGK